MLLKKGLGKIFDTKIIEERKMKDLSFFSRLLNNVYLLEGESSKVSNKVKKQSSQYLANALLMTAASLTISFSLEQTTWADTIVCSGAVLTCNGTSGDDIILGAGPVNIIHGLGGNDYITGNGPGEDYLYGDDGNDVLYGTERNDYLNGGIGNDNYDGAYGDDTIIDESWAVSPFVSNVDVISGGFGNDYISSGFGVDKIHGGPGDELIYPNGFQRDFSLDIVDCGSGANDRLAINSGDSDTAINCEQVENYDR
jgi:Ca2+-binding RTX toxin-like protein